MPGDESMIRSSMLFLLTLSGCMGLGNNYGSIYPVGVLLQTSCVAVRSFDDSLRSAPGLHGADWFVGYLDFGPGMPRGHVFLVSPLPETIAETPGEVLRSADPKGRDFWLEATLTEGAVAVGKTFEALVPPEQHSPSPNSIIVEREAILVRGSIVVGCGKRYLVAVQGNPFGSEVAEWSELRKNYKLFQDNLVWPP